MQDMLFYTHSGVRWFVVLMTLVAFGSLLVRAAQSKPYDKNTHRIMAIWGSLVGLQWLVGVLLFLALGLFDRVHWEHATTMTIALVVAHVYAMVKKRPDAVRYYAGLGSILVVLVLVFIGVAILPQGWQFEVNLPDEGADSTPEATEEAAYLHPAALTLVLNPGE